MKLKSELNTISAYWAMSKFREDKSFPNLSLKNPINKFNFLKASIRDQILLEGKQLPIRSHSYIEKWQLGRYYKWKDSIMNKNNGK